MISLYISERTWLHRLPTGFKLLCLAGCSVLLMAQASLVWNSIALLVSCLLYASIGSLGVRRLLGLARSLWLLLFMLGLAQWVALAMQGQSLDTALPSTLRTLAQIVALVVLADLVTTTTRMQDILDALAPLLWPLRIIGLQPKSIGMGVALMIRSVGLLARDWQQTREAFEARGLKRPGLRLIAPVMSRMMRRAQALSEALAARRL